MQKIDDRIRYKYWSCIGTDGY